MSTGITHTIHVCVSSLDQLGLIWAVNFPSMETTFRWVGVMCKTA